MPRPPKRQTYETINPNSTLTTIDKKKSYPVDMIKDLFIKSDSTLEQLAKEYRLPLTTLKRIARTGQESWYELQKQYQAVRIQNLNEIRGDALVDRQSLLLRLSNLHHMRMNFRIADIEAHFKKWGDFYVRNDDGEILKDGRGQAIELHIPVGTKDILTLVGLEEAIENNRKRVQEVASEAAQNNPSLPDPNVVDVDSYEIFSKKDG